MQEQLLKDVEARMRAGIKALDAEAMLKTWLPAGMQGFEKLQEMFLGQMGGQTGGGAAIQRRAELQSRAIGFQALRRRWLVLQTVGLSSLRVSRRSNVDLKLARDNTRRAGHQ